jgi:hydroxypyruvate reductase
LRRDARKIFYAAVHAAEPAPLVHAALLNAPELRASHPVHVIAIGKAAPGMAAAAVETLGSRLRSCTVVAPAATIGAANLSDNDARTHVIASAHPLPDSASMHAAHVVIEQITAAAPDDIIVALISGGASSLVALPRGPVTIDEYRQTVETLMRAGANVQDLNCVRQRIDVVKAGGLADVAGNRTVLCLLISDVVGNAADIVGSGPFVRGATRDAYQIAVSLGIEDALPASVTRLLRNAPEPARSTNSVRVQVIADNAHALDAAAFYARRLGYDVARIVEPVIGSADDAGRMLTDQLRSSEHGTRNTCIIAGGETVVRVQGSGRGGRNQQMALAAAINLEGLHDTVFLSGGTDGIDGVTDAAGAIVDGGTCDRIRAAGMDPLQSIENNDSFSALAASDDLLMTGATGTNVLDVQLVLRSGDC